jgi:ligand-binding sensor domain-containing protein/signal transduction histidine kinase
LYFDNAGVLWVGTDRGVATYVNGRFNAFEGTDSLIQSPVNVVRHDKWGSVWIATEGEGIWQYNGAVFERWNKDNGLPSDSVRDVLFDEDGVVWMATRNGIAYFDGRSMHSIHISDGLSDEKVRDLRSFDVGGVLAGTRNGLTLLYKNGDMKQIGTSLGRQQLKVNQVFVDSRSRIWIAEETGLWRISDIKQPVWEKIYHETLVSTVYEDISGAIWFGTFGNGLVQYQGDAFQNWTIENGLPNGVVSSVLKDSRGTAWVGTYGGGLAKINLNKKIELYNRSNSALADNRLFHSIEDEKGRIWLATRNGMNRYEYGKGLTKLKRIPDDKYRFINQVDKDLFWLASEEHGVMLWDDKQQKMIQSFTMNDGLVSNSTRVVKQLSDGSLWVGTTNGLSRYVNKQFTNYNLASGLKNQVILDIHEGWDGRIWIAHFLGISSFLPDGTWKHYPLEFRGEPLAAYVIKEFEDYLWVGTNKGLVRFSHKTEVPTLKFYTSDMGLVSDELNKGAIHIDEQGFFWLGTIRGLSKFDPLLTFEKKAPVTVLIDEIEANGERVEPYKPIELNYDDNHFEIHFTSITTQDPNTIQFRYRLRGADPDWQTTYSNSVRYAGLPDGEYRFQVQTISNDGVLSETAGVNITVAPPFWRASWFIFLVLSSLGVLTYLIINNIRASKQIEVERMRVRIAGDLHDDVGASLTEMALQADFIQSYPLDPEIRETMQQLGDMSRKVVTTMDDIVWSIDARNDTLGDLTDRIQDFANHLLSRTDIQVFFHFDVGDENKVLHADTRQNIYLICKEALNNAVKYAEATEIHVHFWQEKGKFHLQVRDNGKGLDAKTKRTGHGLKNMQLRANRLQASLELISENGLTVQLKDIKL